MHDVIPMIAIALLVILWIGILVHSYRQDCKVYVEALEKVKKDYSSPYRDLYNVEKLRKVTSTELTRQLHDALLVNPNRQSSPKWDKMMVQDTEYKLFRWAIGEVFQHDRINLPNNKQGRSTFKEMLNFFVKDSSYTPADMVFELTPFKEAIETEKKPVIIVRPPRTKALFVDTHSLEEEWERLLHALAELSEEEALEVSLGADFVSTLSKALKRQGVNQETVEGWNLQYDLKGLYIAIH